MHHHHTRTAPPPRTRASVMAARASPPQHRILVVPNLPPLRNFIVCLRPSTAVCVIAGSNLGFPKAVKLRLVDLIIRILIVVVITASCADPKILELVALRHIPSMFVWSGGELGYERWSLSEGFSVLFDCLTFTFRFLSRGCG